ncbi:MAG: BACON domain-containing protein [Bacteroidetes bacterium]|nr:BACON domain-containing protein [Bacteroidota bacterium]
MKKVYLLLTLLCLVSCSENEDLVRTIEKSDNDIIKVNMVENTTSISFTTTNCWKLTTDSSWIILSETAGNIGDNVVEIVIKKNDTGKNREAILVVAFDDIKHPFLIKQSCENAFELSEKSITYNSKILTFEL